MRQSGRKIALDAKSIENLKPPSEGQVAYFDRGFPGFCLRVSYGGDKSWYFVGYRVNGKQRRLKLGTYPAMSLAEARQAWRDARELVAKGRDPAEVRKYPKPSRDFASVAEDWLARDQKNKRTVGEAKRIIDKYVAPKWGSLPIDSIGRQDILDLIDGIVDRGTPVMALRIHSRLHRLFAWCVGRGIIAANPMTGLPKPATETKRDRVLTDPEIVAVWHATGMLGYPFGALTRLLLLTGARRDEMANLRWSEITLDEITLAAGRTKTGVPHMIPLAAPALAIITAVPRIAGSDLVFTTTGRTPISGWSSYKKQIDDLAGIAPWRIHDLRRTVATGLQKLGVGLQVTEAILGHVGSRAGVVGIYQRHDFAAEKQASLEAWGAHVTALVEGTKAGKVLPMRGKR